MKPLDDRELTTLLRKWEAPSAPSTLRLSARSRVSISQRLAQWFWRGSIRIPVPLGVAVGAIAVMVVIHFADVLRAPGQTLPKAAAPVIENTISTPGQDSSTAPAAEAKVARPAAELPHPSPELAGFRPVRNVEPRIVGAMR